MVKTDIVKGFKDIVGEDAEKFSIIREVARQTFEKYNFEEAQTPIIEYEEFVKGDKIQEGDESISDIFKLKDKGKRKLALRYEFTFQLKRLAQNKKLPYKRFQIGPVFRDEPISGNRVRQFNQCDIDVVGSGIKDEAEILNAIVEILNALKIKAVIYVNNRKLLKEILSNFDEDVRMQIIRELDKMDKLPEKTIKENLKKYGAEDVLKILKQKPSFFEKYQAYSEIKELKQSCKDYGINVVFTPFLARGLGYYTGNIFEIKSDIKETICGGGTYEIGTNTATGISFSVERLMAVSKLKVELEKYLIVSLGQDRKAVALAKQIRRKGKSASVFYGKPSKAMEYANAYRIKRVIFVGEREVKVKKFKVKNMVTGKELALNI